MQHEHEKKQLVLEELLKGLTAQLATIKKDHTAELEAVPFENLNPEPETSDPLECESPTS